MLRAVSHANRSANVELVTQSILMRALGRQQQDRQVMALSVNASYLREFLASHPDHDECGGSENA